MAARSYGAKTWDDLRDTVHTSMLLSMISRRLADGAGRDRCPTNADLDADTGGGASAGNHIPANLLSGYGFYNGL